MRKLISVLVPAAVAAAPALADETTGTIVAYDRLAHVLVLQDRTIWEFPGTLELPADLEAGDRVRIVFTSAGDSGVGKINSITRVED